MAQVLNLAVLMFACRIPSRRRLDLVTDDAVFRDNWCVFSRARTIRWTVRSTVSGSLMSRKCPHTARCSG